MGSWAVENPGIRTVVYFLRNLKAKQPATYGDLSDNVVGSGMVSRYICFCLKNDLIETVGIVPGPGRYPSRLFQLTKNGNSLLGLFGE